jgi:hypothetical protein
MRDGGAGAVAAEESTGGRMLLGMLASFEGLPMPEEARNVSKSRPPKTPRIRSVSAASERRRLAVVLWRHPRTTEPGAAGYAQAVAESVSEAVEAVPWPVKIPIGSSAGAADSPGWG